MRLVRLIYASTLSKKTDPSELKNIHEVATTHNSEENITGILVFGNDYFLQCLEGGPEAVNKLYYKITADKRHDHPVLLEYAEISERDFDDWAMKLVLLTPKKMKALRRYSIADGFNPYLLSGASALKLMISLSKEKLS